MRGELRRFVLYAAAGFVATGTHYATMMGLVTWGGWPAVAATCAGFAAGACVKYPLNYWGVFASRQRHHIAAIRFVIALAVGFVLNAALLALLLRLVHVHYMILQVATTGVVLFANFALARYWVFLAHHGRHEETI